MPVVLYDANVLYPSTLRDVLIRIGIARLATPRWTDQILDEVFRNLTANRPDLDPQRMSRTRTLMNRAIRDVLVTGYEHRIGDLVLPDPDDRHVLAAAIESGAQVIVTKNLKDFPVGVLEPHGITARHPDTFLRELHGTQPAVLREVFRKIAAAWPAGSTVSDVLKSLDVEAPTTVAAVQAAEPYV